MSNIDSTPDILARICATTRETVARRKRERPESMLREIAEAQEFPRGFYKALKAKADAGQVGLIAEIKKASPSHGLIRSDFDPASLAKAYAEGGATCLSVLTDEPYFQGHLSYIEKVQNACALPVLRKDFIVDPYQVTEARAAGADCILLILAVLSDAQAAELEAAAFEDGMDVLLEVHDAAEAERALILKSPLFGINNRDLRTLEIDLKTTEILAPMAIHAGRLPICESGIQTHSQIARMQSLGVHCFLVGESLMRQSDVRHATQTLLGAA